MDPLDGLLTRFEREYQDTNSITSDRRTEQTWLLRRFAAELEHPLDALTAQDVSTFIGAELSRGLHPNTARKYLGMIRSFITWGEGAGIIDAARATQLKSLSNPRGSSPRSRPKPYKVSEIIAFRQTLAEKFPALPEYGRGSRAMANFLRGRHPNLRRKLWRHARRLQFEAQIALALEQGLRRIEIYRLTIPALHYDNDQVVVLTAKQGPGKSVTRAVPYTTHARNCVQDWLDFRWLLKPEHESPWLSLTYVSDLDRQLAPQTFQAFGQSLYKAFGQGWAWHRFRHTAATEWLRSNVPLEKVRLFMGHATLEQTLAYAEIVASDMDQAFGLAEADFAKRLGLAA